MSAQLKVTLVKSLIKRKPNHRLCAKALGLRKINQSVLVDKNNPCILGLIKKIDYLLKVEDVQT